VIWFLSFHRDFLFCCREEKAMRVFHSDRLCSIATLALLGLSLQSTLAAERALSTPDLSGQWGRDMVFFEPLPSGPGPIVSIARKPDGTMDVFGPWAGDYANPILKPEAAKAVRKRNELSMSGTVVPDMHNSCWPEPPPYVLALHFGVQVVQQRDEIIFIHLINNALRHVPLNVRHPDKLEPSLQGHSVGWFEGDTLVIDTVGIKGTPLSAVDPFGTPHSAGLHVVERYRLIDGEAAAQAQRAHGSVFPNEAAAAAAPSGPYGRGKIDPDPAKKGLQVEFTVQDEGVFTTPWSARVTYRPVIKPWPAEWPEVVCAENPHFSGADQLIPTANRPDF
jgi:hypothetical protein